MVQWETTPPTGESMLDNRATDCGLQSAVAVFPLFQVLGGYSGAISQSRMSRISADVDLNFSCHTTSTHLTSTIHHHPTNARSSTRRRHNARPPDSHGQAVETSQCSFNQAVEFPTSEQALSWIIPAHHTLSSLPTLSFPLSAAALSRLLPCSVSLAPSF